MDFKNEFMNMYNTQHVFKYVVRLSIYTRDLENFPVFMVSCDFEILLKKQFVFIIMSQYVVLL